MQKKQAKIVRLMLFAVFAIKTEKINYFARM